jgi:ribulose-phosphate 3-epimerase
MARWNELPRDRLLLDVSLWSANLAYLARDIAVVDGRADSFHFDVADAHFAPSLLFFPDLIRALRPLTAVPFHAHLMVERPLALVDDVVTAGVDHITVHIEAEDPQRALETIRTAGRSAGIALKLETPVEHAEPFLKNIETLLLLGTAIGVKGQDLAPEACDRLRAMKRLLAGHPDVRLIADGAIRDHTVPLLRAGGADVIVPGSLIFGNQVGQASACHNLIWPHLTEAAVADDSHSSRCS